MTRQKGRAPKSRSGASGRANPPPAPLSGIALRRRRALRASVLLGLTGIAALLIAAGLSGEEDKKAEKVSSATTTGSCTADEKFDDNGRDHVDTPEYSVDPPAAGDHTAEFPTSAEIYEPGSVPPDGELVHAMEHGMVVLWYNPEIATAQIKLLRAIHHDDPSAVIVAPGKA